VTLEELIAGGLHVLCLLGKDATLCAAGGKSGSVEVTELYRQLYEAAGDRAASHCLAAADGAVRLYSHARPLCVPKIRFCNIDDEDHRGQAVM
jgi:hypothetical protein